MINVVFFGSSAYCLPLIEALHKNFQLKLIITRPDKPIGRSQTLTATAAKQFGQTHSIPVLTPATLTGPDQELLLDAIINTHPTIAVVADYGLLIPEEIFTVPAFQTLNIHFSKLPQFRGPSPVQYSILNGETHAWISFMQLEKGLDTGPIVLQKDFPISSFATTNILYSYLFEEAAKLLPGVITKYIEGDYVPQVQSPQPRADRPLDEKFKVQSLITTKHIEKDDAYISWDLIQEAIHGRDIEKSKRPEFLQQFEGSWSHLVERAIRAFSPWPEVWSEIKFEIPASPAGRRNSKFENGIKRLKIKKAYINSNGHLRLLEVQLEGKNVVGWADFIRSYPKIISNKH